MMEKNKTISKIREFFGNNMTVLYIIILFVLARIFVPRFATLGNLNNIIRQSAVPIISACMISLIMITCNVDLSCGYLVGLVSCFAGIFVFEYNWPLWQVLAVCILGAALVGCLNGFLIAIIKVPSFIATLGTGLCLFGMAMKFGTEDFEFLPQHFVAWARTKIGPFPMMVYYSIILVAIFWYIAHKSTFGRELRIMGLNPAAAKMAGIRSTRNIFITYAMNGAISALCSILLTIRTDTSAPELGGANYPFEAMTAAVIGGTSLLGGKVNIINCALGAIVIKIIENCINLLNISPYLYKTTLGIVVLLALVLDAIRNKRV